MIIGILGKTGVGKTSLMVKLATKHWRSGKHFYSDIWLKSIKPYMDRWSVGGWLAYNLGLSKGRYFVPYSNYREYEEREDLYKLPAGSTILVDEATVYFDSKAVKFLPLHIRKKITDSRKDGIDIWWSSQRIRGVCTDLRDLTHIYYQVSSFPLLPAGYLRVYFAKMYFDIDENGKFENVKSAKTKVIFLTRKDFDAYDTYQKIRPELQDNKEV